MKDHGRRRGDVNVLVLSDNEETCERLEKNASHAIYGEDTTRAEETLHDDSADIHSVIPLTAVPDKILSTTMEPVTYTRVCFADALDLRGYAGVVIDLDSLQDPNTDVATLIGQVPEGMPVMFHSEKKLTEGLILREGQFSHEMGGEDLTEGPRRAAASLNAFTVAAHKYGQMQTVPADSPGQDTLDGTQDLGVISASQERQL